MTDKESVDIVDAVDCICPQLDFLAYVLSMINDDGIDRHEAGGLFSIITTISWQLKKAVKEADHE
ncbi:MAG: hypothetical protein WCR46_06890 [Deltaproteobacteria bacterium]